MKIKRNYLIKLAPAALLVVGAYWLLGIDFFTFLTWWEMLGLLVLIFMLVTSRIFRCFLLTMYIRILFLNNLMCDSYSILDNHTLLS